MWRICWESEPEKIIGTARENHRSNRRKSQEYRFGNKLTGEAVQEKDYRKITKETIRKSITGENIQEKALWKNGSEENGVRNT